MNNIYQVITEIVRGITYDTPDEVAGKVWVEVYEALKGMYLTGYVKGCRDLEKSIGEEKLAVIPPMEESGIRAYGEIGWGEEEEKLFIPRVSV